MEQDQVSFEWVAPDSQVSEVRSELTASGAEVDLSARRFEPAAEDVDDYSHAAFEPLTIIVATMGIVALAERVVSVIKGAHQDGLIVDARTQPLQIRPHPALDRGVVLVVTESGAEPFDSRRHGELAEAIKVLRA